MSYALAAEVQSALYDRLTGAAGLAGVAIYDALPPGGGGGSYVVIGPEEVVDRSDASGMGAEHRAQISVITEAAGFLPAKAIAAEISQALAGPPPALGSGRIVAVRFSKATARRSKSGDIRRIDLVYHIRVEA